MNVDSFVARFIDEAKATKNAVIVFYAAVRNGAPIMRMRSSSATPEAAMRFILQVDDTAVNAAAQAVGLWLTENGILSSTERALLDTDLQKLARVALEAGRAAAGAKAARTEEN